MRLEGYSDYEIYPETGQVWSYKRNRFIGTPNEKGYIVLQLIDNNGNGKMWKMHRLIYYSVYGKIPKGMQVNHIDENKANNSIHNLNIMSNKENCYWGTHIERLTNTLRKKYGKAVIALHNNSVKMYFPSTSNAEKKGYKHYHICRCCKGLEKQHKGYNWQYIDDFLADWWEQEMEKDTI